MSKFYFQQDYLTYKKGDVIEGQIQNKNIAGVMTPFILIIAGNNNTFVPYSDKSILDITPAADSGTVGQFIFVKDWNDHKKGDIITGTEMDKMIFGANAHVVVWNNGKGSIINIPFADKTIIDYYVAMDNTGNTGNTGTGNTDTGTNPVNTNPIILTPSQKTSGILAVVGAVVGNLSSSDNKGRNTVIGLLGGLVVAYFINKNHKVPYMNV